MYWSNTQTLLCPAQRQTNFTNTLLQDITIFTRNDTTQLEDWLLDVESAAELSAESRTKLAQAKSRALTHTLITEALTSGKSWEDIKDLLHLKICSADIHTSVSCFMEIQWEKESLESYIHHFKRKAKWCNFTNSAATIRIFIKGLKDIHTIASSVYEKAPQTLTDAISKAEKLQATQQLTTTLLPMCTVNVMFHEDDRCFQYQESGHIVCHCPNVCCFKYSEYGHIMMDCPDQIPPSGTLAHHHRKESNIRHCTRSPSKHHHQDRYRHSRSRSQSHPHRYQSYSHHNSYRSHSRSHHRCHHRSTSQCHHSSTYRYCHDKPHCRLSSHRTTLAHSRNHSRSRSSSAYWPSKKTQYKTSSWHSRTPAKSQDRRHPRATIDDPQTDFYSSGESSNSNDDDHLN